MTGKYEYPSGPAAVTGGESEYTFYSNCVSWPEDKLDDLDAFSESAVPITYRTLRKHLGGRQTDELARRLGFSVPPEVGLTMRKDWAIEFVRGRCFGKTAYAVVWSGIEYVFVHRSTQ